MEAQKTCLFDRHKDAGAKIVDFAGWQMPIQYPEGIIAEHLFTRKHCGIFDVSHMGRLRFTGQDAAKFLQYALTSNVFGLKTAKSQYCIISNDSGNAIDDAYLYRFTDDEYTLIVNASNKQKDIEHLASIIGDFDTEMHDLSDSLAMIAVQGPESETVLTTIEPNIQLPADGRNNIGITEICGAQTYICRTGYTGEPICFELMVPTENAGTIWDKLLENGAKPIGLGARDTLRIEAALPLYGHEYSEEMPIFSCTLAKFGVSFDEEKGDFIGKDALKKQLNSLEKVIKPFSLADKGIARDGAVVLHNEKEVGIVTSGTMAPYWKTEGQDDGQSLTDDSAMHAVGLALIDKDIKAGDTIHINLRGRNAKAIVGSNIKNREGKYCLAIEK
jgi:aminomethyltransferase